MKKVFKIFSHWESEEEEKWLADMHKQGWALAKRSLRFQFEYEKADEIVYKKDYQPNLKKHEREEYIKLYEESGWEYVTRQSDMYYFRTGKGDVDMPDIYTDIDSKVDQLQKILQLLFLCYFPICITTVVQFIPSFDGWTIYLLVLICGHLLMIQAIINTWLKIKRLKKSIL
jgi:Protein of unknown function (DUF2812)